MSVGSKTTGDVGDWRPGCDLEALRARDRLLRDLRAYLSGNGLIEVETPLATSSVATDPAIEPMRTRYRGPGAAHGQTLYLQTSPEHAMKRLLAYGSGSIFQICKAFRNGEAGRLHNPEFTLLEWYLVDCDLDTLFAQVLDVARLALGRPDLQSEKRRYAELFSDWFGIDILDCTTERLRQVAITHGVIGAAGLALERDGWLDLLLSHLIQPRLGDERLCFLTDYPASQAALARLQPGGQWADRFEAFWQGIELANGYHELADADEQGARAEADNCRRRAAGQRPLRVDRHLLSALEAGLPDCVGVAVGLDRLLMLRLGRETLDDVLTFSMPRC